MGTLDEEVVSREVMCDALMEELAIENRRLMDIQASVKQAVAELEEESETEHNIRTGIAGARQSISRLRRQLQGLHNQAVDVAVDIHQTRNRIRASERAIMAATLSFI